MTTLIIEIPPVSDGDALNQRRRFKVLTVPELAQFNLTWDRRGNWWLDFWEPLVALPPALPPSGIEETDINSPYPR